MLCQLFFFLHVPYIHACIASPCMYVLVHVCIYVYVCCVQSAMAPLAFAAMCGHGSIVQHFLKLNDIDISLPAVSPQCTCYIHVYIHNNIVHVSLGACMYVHDLIEIFASTVHVYISISYGRLHDHSLRQLRLNKESVLSYWLTDMAAW